MEYNTIFKRYDIRGKYPEDINKEVAEKIAYAYLDVMKPKEAIIGHDNIDGSQQTAETLSGVLRMYGVKVFEVGLVTTPMLYFAGAFNNTPMSIMCTASHLGEGFTGIKLNKDGIPLEEEKLLEIKRKFEELERDFVSVDGVIDNSRNLGIKVAVYDDYIKAIAQQVSDNLSGIKVASDLGNGANSMIAEKLFKELGLESSLINCQIKSKNLNHQSNPKIKQNRKDLENEIFKTGSKLGLIWDGDCDRCYFVDGFGEVIPPEYVAVVISRLLKEKHNYSKITADVRASSAVEFECKKFNVEVKRIKAWHVPIKYEMEQDSGIGFGFEVSGHYVFRDFYKIDDGMLAGVSFINALKHFNINLEQDLKNFKEKYYILEEINYSSKVTEEDLQSILSDKYKDGQISMVDGISVYFPTWRFNVRSSRTEPILRLNISGTDREEVEKRLQEIEKAISGKRLAS